MGELNHGEQQQIYFEEIMLHKPPPVRLYQKRVPTEHVRFDANNPRLRYKKDLFPDKTEKELLFKDADTNWLLKDIQEKGVIEPIYVRPVRTENAVYYIVVEGNRRTAVMQELHEKHPNNPNFCYIPARVMPEETTEEQTELLMMSQHVTGKLKWAAHEQAGSIWRAINVLRIPEAQLVNTLHMGAPSIRKAAESYALLEYFKKCDGGKYAAQAEGKWSFFAEMLKVKELRRRHHEKGQEWDDEFCRWVGEGRIPKAEDVRDLPEILMKQKARNLFHDEPVDTAFLKAKREIDKTTPSRNSKLFKDLENLIVSGKAAQMSELDEARDNDVARDTVIEAYSVLMAFMERAGVRIPATPRRVA